MRWTPNVDDIVSQIQGCGCDMRSDGFSPGHGGWGRQFGIAGTRWIHAELRPNAPRQVRRWQASKPVRLAARHHARRSRPAQGPRQRRHLHAMLGRGLTEICHIRL